MDTVICKLCKKSYANKGKFAVTCHRVQNVAVEDFLTFKLISLVLFYLGNTTNLQYHLEKHHRHETDAPTSSIKNPVKKMFQPKVNTVTQSNCKGKLSSEKNKKLNDLTLKFIVGKALPISTTDNEHFKALVKELDPRFVFLWKSIFIFFKFCLLHFLG